MAGNTFGLVPLFMKKSCVLLFRIENVFAPSREKFSEMLPRITSIAVSIPTSAIIPMAITETVSTARSI